MSGAAPTGRWTYDPAADRIEWSPEMCAVFGVGAAPADYEAFLALVHPEDRARLAENHRRALAGELERNQHQYRVLRPDGTEHWVVDEARRAADGTYHGTTFALDTARAVVDRYGLLLDVGEAIDGAGGSDEAMQRVCELLAERVGGSLTIVLGGDEGPEFGAWAAKDPVLHDHLGTLARAGVRWIDGGPTREVLRTGESTAIGPLDEAFVEQLAGVPGALPAARGFIGRSVGIAPLVARGEVIGALLQTVDGRPVGRADLALLEDLGRRVGLALANLRLLEDERRARRAAEEASAMLDELVATAPFGIGFFAPDGTYLRLNAKLEEMNGLPEAAHVGRRPSEVLPDGGEGVEAVVDEVLRTGVPQTVEMTVRLPGTPDEDRSFVVGWYRVRVGGEVLGAGAIVTEVTDRLRATQQLTEQHDRLSRLLEAMDSLGEGVFVLRDGRLEWVNEAAAALVGRSVEELLALPSVFEVVAETERPLVEGLVDEVLRSGEPVRFETRVARPDGRLGWAELAGRALLAEDGAARIIGVGRDIDDRKASELALARSHRRASFFADASPLLEATFDLPALLGGVARLLVEREVCEACAFELAEPGGWRRLAAAPDRADLDAGAELPLVAGGRTLGRLLLEGTRDEPLAEELAERVAPVVANALLFAERARVARVLQESLLPPALPAVPGVTVATRYAAGAARLDVGGDFYDLFASGPSAWNAVVGDVCGKGAEAAAITSLARHTLRTLAGTSTDPADLLGALNGAMLREPAVADDRFVTMVVGRLLPLAGGLRLDVGCAGHPPPLVLRAGGEAEHVAVRGPLLGLADGARYTTAHVDLGAGDVVVLYTDGLSEAARSRTGDGWVGVAASLRGEGPEAVASGLERWARERRGEEDLADDLALLVLGV